MKEKISKKVIEEKRKAGFDGNIELEEKEVILDPLTKQPLKNSFFGQINQKTKDVEIKYKSDYAREQPEKAEKTIIDIERHEINHIGDARARQGCPKSLEKHLEIYEAIADVLKPKGFSSFDVQYVANAFEDFIDNVNLSNSFDIEGLINFYEDVGNTAEDKKFGNFYEAFVKLQAIFWNHPKKKILNRFYQHKPEVKQTLENFLKRSGLEEIKTKVNVNGEELEVRDRQAMLNYINDESRWQEFARIFAEEFSKLMQPGYALPIPGLSGAGTKGREEESGEKEGEEEDGINWDDLEGGNYFDKEMKDPEKRKEQAFKRFQKGNARPNWLNYYEALDAVYERLARRLNIKAEVFTRTTKMPLAYFGKYNFDPERDKPRHLTFGFDDKGKVVLKKKKLHIDMDLEYKVAEKGFPEVRFVMLDTSGSMLEAPDGGNIGNTNYIPWGTNSKYHYALLAWYGFIEYLRQNRLLRTQKISLANFSDVTAVGKGLEQAKRIALKPQFGDTYIDLDKVKYVLEGRNNLIFTISDGEIQNWYKIRDEFIKQAKHNYYFHLQIGQRNEMTSDLEAEGIPVYYVKGEYDLWQKVIEISDKLYKKKTRGEIKTTLDFYRKIMKKI